MEVPNWTIESHAAFNKTYNIGSAIYSATTPGVTHIADPEESARVARQMNEYNAQFRNENPMNGFFATVPSLQHTQTSFCKSYATRLILSRPME